MPTEPPSKRGSLLSCCAGTLTFGIFFTGEAIFALEVTRGPYLQQGTSSSMVVKWRTSLMVDGQVRFGLSPESLIWENSEPGLTHDHSVVLTNLSAGTTYYYSVGSGGTNLVSGDDLLFKTAPAVAQPTRIWVLGDSGIAEGAISVRDAYYAYARGRPTDVWLMLGDNAYNAGTDQEYQTELFDVFEQMLKRNVLFPTLGNHEVFGADAQGHMPYLDIFSLPAAGEAGGVPSGTERYYSFDYSNIHLVCLDSESSDRSPDGPMFTWLEEDLAANEKDWLIAFWHTPPYTKGSYDSDRMSDSGGRLIEMRERALPILEGHGVDLVLCGHSHVYERSYLLDRHYAYSTAFSERVVVDGGDGRIDGDGPYRKPVLGPSAHDGAVYVVAGCSSHVRAVGSLDHPAMYLSSAVLGSVVIDVDGPRLDLRFLRETGAIDDYFTIVKGGASYPAYIMSLGVVSGEVTATWNSEPGATYHVEESDGLEPIDWRVASGGIVATNNVTVWNGVTPPGVGRRFFRVVRD